MSKVRDKVVCSLFDNKIPLSLVYDMFHIRFVIAGVWSEKEKIKSGDTVVVDLEKIEK